MLMMLARLGSTPKELTLAATGSMRLAGMVRLGKGRRARVVGNVDADGAGLAHRADAAARADGRGVVAPAHAVGQRAALAEAVELADALAGVAAQVIVLALHRVEFLDDGERDDDVVLLEDKERVGVVQQHVRVDDELLHAGFKIE